MKFCKMEMPVANFMSSKNVCSVWKGI
jgi:hypothetical protein